MKYNSWMFVLVIFCSQILNVHTLASRMQNVHTLASILNSLDNNHWHHSILENKVSTGTIDSNQRIKRFSFALTSHPDRKEPISSKAIPTLGDPFVLSLTNIADDNVDNILQHLVSPAPESFHVIDTSIKKIESTTNTVKTSPNALLDIESICKFLVKPNFGIQLYREDNLWKWDIVPDQNNGKLRIKHMDGWAELDYHLKMSTPQLHHKLTSLELASVSTDAARNVQLNIEEQVESIEKRLILTLGSDLRGRRSADAAFQLALSGVQRSSHIFNALADICSHELKRAALRSSFSEKNVLQMIEKFAVCGVKSPSILQMYHTAGLCLEKKGSSDEFLLDSLKNGDFGLQSDRPLLWLWRFSARQKKINLDDNTVESSHIQWHDYFHDVSKGLVVDFGCGCGISLFNLSSINRNEPLMGNLDGTPSMKWYDYNYAGADLNKQLIRYANGVVSRQEIHQKRRIHFFCSTAISIVNSLQTYPGNITLVSIQFPSPFRLNESGPGNSQLPSSSADGYMISKDLVDNISTLLKKSNGTLLFQSKCEDVAVYTKNLFVQGGDMECIPCVSHVQDIDKAYESKEKPKRVRQWLKLFPDSERAQGSSWSSISLLPLLGRTETEVQCDYDNTVIHRCKLKCRS